MCGFVGYFDTRNEHRVERQQVMKMTDSLIHRGPDSCGYFIEDNVGLGFRRLSIIDLENGNQPIYNEDKSIVLMCNGEIFNYIELRDGLRQKGHRFYTNCDVEALVHLYEEHNIEFLNMLNGQFSFVIYDRKENTLFLARDHFGITPLYYTFVDGLFIFASEIKSILRHPSVAREVDLVGLDQVLSFPGLVSPRTMFKKVESLKSGHYIKVKNSDVKVGEYWDLEYPRIGEVSCDKPETVYVEELRRLLAQSVKYRLQADVPVGLYLSGGLDSSFIAAMVKDVSPESMRHSFSIGFPDRHMDESKYQKVMAEVIGSQHHEIKFDWIEITDRLSDMIYHCECPVKETYNTCSMALSESAKNAKVPVILTGEGADEIFAGYVGYRFDQFGVRNSVSYGLEEIMEEEYREKLWGDRSLFYETNHYTFREVKSALYSDELRGSLADFECLNFELVNKERLRGRHFVHQRSYLDFKLRLSDHLISDHGDKMALANSVEARYPFLDIELANFARSISPDLKLNNYIEKYILKKSAVGLVPQEIIDREKFGFHAPGSSYLLQQNIEWIKDLLSYERIKRQGFFDPDTVENLKTKYSEKGFKLNLPFESDLLMIVLSFGIFLDVFDLPTLN